MIEKLKPVSRNIQSFLRTACCAHHSIPFMEEKESMLIPDSGGVRDLLTPDSEGVRREIIVNFSLLTTAGVGSCSNLSYCEASHRSCWGSKTNLENDKRGNQTSFFRYSEIRNSTTWARHSMILISQDVLGFAAKDTSGYLEPYIFQRRPTRPDDVIFRVLYCGICHSDLNQIRDERSEDSPRRYPIVPSHEITGIVASVGDRVMRFKIGNRVGVGCLVNSCGKCGHCKQNLEQYCEEKCVWTYNDSDIYAGGEPTFGGYSTLMKAEKTLDFIIDSVSAPHSFDTYLPLLRTNGKLVGAGEVWLGA